MTVVGGNVKIHREELEVSTSADTDVHDLTHEVERAVAASGVTDGQVLVFTPGSTAAITTIELESGALADFKRLLETLAPSAGDYEHNRRWGDGNGYSHVRAALVGPSLTVPVAGGRLVHGTWQQIVLCDFDNRPRRRKVVLQVMGE
jgi:secondary thiamine-phosphate synthase enzyme